MDYKTVKNGTQHYIELLSCTNAIINEQDALNLVALCGEHETNLLMIHDSAISDDFYRLRTGVAGNILQKFINYHIKTAAVVANVKTNKGKFKEMASEANKGNHFRIFENKEAAEKWLLND